MPRKFNVWKMRRLEATKLILGSAAARLFSGVKAALQGLRRIRQRSGVARRSDVREVRRHEATKLVLGSTAARLFSGIKASVQGLRRTR